MPDWFYTDAGIDVWDEWLTGHPQEDELTLAGQCPYQTGYGGWGDPYALCGDARSPNGGDWPYCRPHAAQIRSDRGRGGYVG